MARTRPDPARELTPSTEGDAPVVPRPYPSADLIQHTIRVWEPRLGRALSEEDARHILENVVGFFRVLHDWDRKQRPGDSESKTTTPIGITAGNDKIIQPKKSK